MILAALRNPGRRRRGPVAGRTQGGLRARVGRAVAAVGLFAICVGAASPAYALSFIRDAEIENYLREWEMPVWVAAGLDPAAMHIYLINSNQINSFVAAGQNIFIYTGLLMKADDANQVIGVMAHETGHIAGGDVIRGGMAMSKATVPMLIGMAVGVAAMIAGAGSAGIGAMMLGQSAAESQYLQFSRAQESTADQRAITYLNRTHQSGEGLLHAFERLANERAMTANYDKTFISDHPADRQRIDELQNRVNASPWKNVKDSPAAIHEFHMIQAKLIGYLDNPSDVLQRFPPSDISDEALYARAMAYFREPNMTMALKEINTLIQREPKNPYFWEMLGQIYVEMAQPEKGIAPYQKSVDLLPDAPLIRTALAQAQLATENVAYAKPALANLKVALQYDRDSPFGWYEIAEAYSMLGNRPMADLATAERYYWVGGMRQAAYFAGRAEQKLPKGSTEWQRASDIVSIAGPRAAQH